MTVYQPIYELYFMYAHTSPRCLQYDLFIDTAMQNIDLHIGQHN